MSIRFQWINAIPRPQVVDWDSFCKLHFFFYLNFIMCCINPLIFSISLINLSISNILLKYQKKLKSMDKYKIKVYG